MKPIAFLCYDAFFLKSASYAAMPRKKILQPSLSFRKSDSVIGIVGMGYVGLTLSVALADRGFTIWGIENHLETLSKLQCGEPHFHEKGFASRLRQALAKGSLRFVESLSEIGNSLSVYIITVGTPLSASGASRIDMIKKIAGETCHHMSDDGLVILRSTVRLGTTREVVLPLLRRSGKSFMLAYCPERTIEGNAIEELSHLPQIIGAIDEASLWRASSIFQHMTATTIHVSSLEAAEIIKLLDNSFRDVSFAIGNEIALLCEAAGLDGQEVVNAANKGYDRTNIPFPGFVGGPCLHKDPHILIESMQRYDYAPHLISYGRQINKSLPNYVCQKIRSRIELGSGTGHKITVMGLAFKGHPETSDLRASPSLDLVAILNKIYPDAHLCGHDFVINDQAIRKTGLEAVSVEEGFEEASLVIIATNNKRYQWLDIDLLTKRMVTPRMIFDVWSVLPVSVRHDAQNYTVLSIGNSAAKEKLA